MLGNVHVGEGTSSVVYKDIVYCWVDTNKTTLKIRSENIAWNTIRI